MKAINHIEDFINQAAKLYFELCARAEADYQLGRHSGAKRSILLSLRQHGASLGESLTREFADPEAVQYGQQMMFDLIKDGLVKIEMIGAKPHFKLSEAGIKRAHAIHGHEQEIMKQMSAELSPADLRKAAWVMDRFRHESKTARGAIPIASAESEVSTGRRWKVA